MSNQALRAAATGQHPKNDMPSLLDRMKPQIAAALPNSMSADRMARIALTCFRTTPALQRCEPASFLAAVMQAAQLGLEPGLNGSAYLVPYGNQVQMIPGYRGLIDLARRSGAVQSINAHIVYEHDTFEIELGLEDRISHRPKLDGERGAKKLVYAIAKFKDGGHQFVWMTMEEVERIRSRSKASKNGPWVTDYDEMVKKTAIRRLCKYLPLTVELSVGVAVSDAADAGAKAVIDGDFVLIEEQLASHDEPEPEQAQATQ